MLNNKSLQAFLAIAPPVVFAICMLGYFIFIFSVIGGMRQIENSGNQEFPVAFFSGLAFFIVMILVASLLSLFSLIYFIIHAAKNPNLKEGNMLVVWILILVLVSMIGSLIYWLVEIRLKNPKPVIPN